MDSELEDVLPRVPSGTGPIRRVPSAADTTRVSSFPGSVVQSCSHYSPYGTVFAAAAQQAAIAAAVTSASDTQPQPQHQQVHKNARRPPLRQHSFDTRLMLQHQFHKQQQQQQRAALHHMQCQKPGVGGSCIDLRHLASHPLDCTCEDCGALGEQLYQQQQHAGAAMADLHGKQLDSQHYQQDSIYRLAPLLSGPPAFGGNGSDSCAATGGASETIDMHLTSRAAHWNAVQSAGQPAAAAAVVGSGAGFRLLPRQQSDPPSQQHLAMQLPCDKEGLGPPAHLMDLAEHMFELRRQRQQMMPQHLGRHHHVHSYQQQLLYRHTGQHQQVQQQQQHSHGLAPMMSAPPCSAAHGGPAGMCTSAAPTAALVASMFQIPAGLPSIRARPQVAAVAHTAHTTHGWANRHTHTAGDPSAGAAAAAAGRDMVIMRHQHHQQQQKRAAPTGARYRVSEHGAAPASQQPKLPQQELQQLLQHQLRQLVPGANAPPAHGAAGPAHTAGAAAAAAAVDIDLQDPAVLLELLRHSGMCKVPEDACALGWRCTWVKRLWIHMHTCRSSECASVHCRLGKQILPHYKECSDAACGVCNRVRAYDKALAELQALTARAASWAREESVDSPAGTTDDAPSTVYIAGEEEGAAPGSVGAVAMSPALSVTSKPAGTAAQLPGRQQQQQSELEQEVDQEVLQRQQFFPDTW